MLSRLLIALTVLGTTAISGSVCADAQNQAVVEQTTSDAVETNIPGPVPRPILPPDYVIGPEDILQVSVWREEALSRTVPVRPDGKISLPLLRDVQAAGLTAPQLSAQIAKGLSRFVPDPEVTVIVSDVRSIRVSVLGEVQRPGVLILRSTATVLEAIAMVGGFAKFALPTNITILRTEASGVTRKLYFNYSKAISPQSDQPNMVLQSGDILIVP